MQSKKMREKQSVFAIVGGTDVSKKGLQHLSAGDLSAVFYE